MVHFLFSSTSNLNRIERLQLDEPVKPVQRITVIRNQKQYTISLFKGLESDIFSLSNAPDLI